eukprot:CAMPEP_0170135624 /NCGR_PEP_ID=MMETSP0033_2-20121228/2573_1 /TAXON_ID=195969 /ORGANISM="Dolichomastix tenuilepis, Strain CCMP3274" /LENGTH=238 /DNA_ID=CAMNT_0010371227 /DNA_START=361 /DNA_END=1075 /DNA_ORIENTATION=+
MVELLHAPVEPPREKDAESEPVGDEDDGGIRGEAPGVDVGDDVIDEGRYSVVNVCQTLAFGEPKKEAVVTDALRLFGEGSFSVLERRREFELAELTSSRTPISSSALNCSASFFAVCFERKYGLMYRKIWNGLPLDESSARSAFPVASACDKPRGVSGTSGSGTRVYKVSSTFPMLSPCLMRMMRSGPTSLRTSLRGDASRASASRVSSTALAAASAASAATAACEAALSAEARPQRR